MIYLIAIFCSPLALLFAGKPISAVFNLVLYLVAVALTLTLFFAHVGFLLWLAAFVHAVLAIHSAREDRRARWIADAMRRP
ncbi:MAG TPA: hypothetical protein VG387_01570 [Rhizomicrobium sp.]|jgi:hypothetical protein|nr:hypothetical protein [Rhizomicrobium sp.]